VIDNLMQLMGFKRTPVDASDPQAVFEAYLRVPPSWYSRNSARYEELDRAILALPPEAHVTMVRTGIERRYDRRNWKRSVRLRELMQLLERRKLPYGADDVRAILTSLRRPGTAYSYPATALVRNLARAIRQGDLLEACRPELEALQRANEERQDVTAAERRKLDRLLFDLLHDGDTAPIRLREDEWGVRAIAALAAIDEGDRGPWAALLDHCVRAGGSKPSQRWQQGLTPLIDALGRAPFERLARAWLGYFADGGARPPQHGGPGVPYDRGSLLYDENADLLKGLAWACAGSDNARIAAALCDAAIAGYRKLRRHGPRSLRVANACLLALRELPGLHGAAQLERLRLSVKQPSARRKVEQALEVAAERAGLSRDDLEERTVPDYGLVQGLRVFPFGGARAELAIEGARAELRWFGADGRPRKGVPTAVRRDHGDGLKALKTLHKDVGKMLGAQRDRLERLPLARRSWSYADWRERYLEQPLIGGMVARMLWRFEGDGRAGDGICSHGQLVDADGCPLDWLTPETTVRPWHPVDSDASEVLAWRDLLEEREITQPFKQAHREVYLLTEAERSTGTYSNRFAAHVLRQHQFNGLCAARGWSNQLRLMVDDDYEPASLALPQWDLRAEFWIEGLGESYGTDTNEAGTYLFVGTDQVRFYPLDAHANRAYAGEGRYHGMARPIPIETIPPLVLSEVLRDVDLFVGVASVGNDPEWQDGGPQGRYRDYWRSYAFGDLGVSARTRKEVLARLVPRLELRDRCTLEGRFLRVQGQLRSYKIHLGSGNILMEPNDQYLCIVQGRGAGFGGEQLFLPFEGDGTLALILSKAFLLAADDTIDDPTIVTQIRR
jgi:hypothetical protein